MHDNDRPTLPPPPAEIENQLAFERDVATHGEWLARMANVAAVVRRYLGAPVRAAAP
jgi:hypothetical protein